MPCLPRDLDLAYARVASAPRVGGVPIVVIPYIHPQIVLELLYLYLTLHLAEVHPRIAACKQDHYMFVPLVGTVHVHAFPKFLQFSQRHSQCLVWTEPVHELFDLLDLLLRFNQFDNIVVHLLLDMGTQTQ